MYTNKKALHAIAEQKIQSEGKSASGMGYKTTFSCLAEEVQESVIEKAAEGKVVSVVDLCSRYVELQAEDGVQVTN